MTESIRSVSQSVSRPTYSLGLRKEPHTKLLNLQCFPQHKRTTWPSREEKRKRWLVAGGGFGGGAREEEWKRKRKEKPFYSASLSIGIETASV